MSLSTPWVAFQHPAHQALAQEFHCTVFSRQFNIACINFSHWKIHCIGSEVIIHRPMAEVFFWNLLIVTFFCIATLQTVAQLQ